MNELEGGKSARAVAGASSDATAALAGELLNEQTVNAVLHMLVSQALTAMACIDGASVSLLRTGNLETTTATSHEVSDVDAVEYRSGLGPCIDASRGQMVSVGLAASRDRWPEFAEAAMANGFRGVLSTALAVREQPMGSLNLYSRTQESFDDDDIRIAQLFAHQASVVLTNAAAFATAEMVDDRRRQAIASTDLIGQAKGMLMASEGIGADEASEVLRRASQHSNRRLRDVAAGFVERLGAPSEC